MILPYKPKWEYQHSNGSLVLVHKSMAIMHLLALWNSLLVTTDFTTHGESHFYGLLCPSADSLDPMDHFCTFDVSKIIPKNMNYIPYATFKPILTYICRYDP